MQNKLHYGDNLEILPKIPSESVDLCYIDPPFNSNRDYNQIYNNIDKEDRAQVQAFTDTWEWDDEAMKGFARFDLDNNKGDKNIPLKTKELILALYRVLNEGSLLAYIVSIAQRILEIHRILKPTGSFYLHCDSTASHYLKILLDSIFCAKDGSMRNEIVWCYSRMAAKGQKQLSRCHDIIFWYSKSKDWTFNVDKNKIALCRKK